MSTLKSKTKIALQELNDAELNAVSGALGGTVCVLGYCVSADVDLGGLKVSVGKGESIGTQAYNAVMKGMHSV
jgi:hypothetical protein